MTLHILRVVSDDTPAEVAVDVPTMASGPHNKTLGDAVAEILDERGGFAIIEISRGQER